MDALKSTLALLAALAMASCSTLADDSGGVSQLPPGSGYVAMGSSFASGPGLDPLEPGSPKRCARSLRNYANLLARRLDLTLDDQSCSGATTANILTPWNELPAQLDAVTADTRLVTITVGGNDLNYVGMLFAAACQPRVGLNFNGKHFPCPPPAKPPSKQTYARTRANLVRIARAIRARAPQATVVFVQYVTLVPPGKLCAAEPLGTAQQREARAIGARLARITRVAARKTGSLVLPVQQLSAKHTACDAVPWSNGMPGDVSKRHGVPWHPNAAGHAAIADALAKFLIARKII